ncbi:hypothetical protein ACHHYP_12232 [Achlya hypogyna]|uniref:Uncharacterized protein n=1 Tax=Achlya hypogyna TaxID=1202772 RepID=A0A1V9YHK2_ACHHY|nr:hypothetical protein ACHHYP_12232 [Achlya hypogyna]
MQQQLIEGFIIDHLDTPGRSAKVDGAFGPKRTVRYDTNGRRMQPKAAVKTPRTPTLPSPRTKAPAIVFATPAKRLVRSAVADLSPPRRVAKTAPARPPEHFPVISSPRALPLLDPSLARPTSSPLEAWGIPREYILEFIRLSVLPCTWAMNLKSVGDWVTMAEAAPAQDPAAILDKLHTLLPQLEPRDRSPRPRPPPPISPGRPHALREVPFEAKVHELLVELHADPRAWTAFHAKVNQYMESKKRGKGTDIVRENVAALARDPAAARDQRKAVNAQKQVATRAKFLAQLELEHEHRVELLDRHARQVNAQKRIAARRQQTCAWLRAVLTVCHLERWRQRTRHEKSKKLQELHQLAAACKIQRLWRRRVHVANSKAMLTIIIKTRRILWSLTFRLYCKKLAVAASVLRRFFIDYFNNGDSESGNFRVMMARWRWRVINAQRASKTYIACTRARLHALGQIWDKVDHERQRLEKQQLGGRIPVPVPDAPITPPQRRRPQRRNATDGLTDLSLIQEQLVMMQSMLTPIEIQRMQAQSVQVVRIPKNIKMRLLVNYLSKRRAAHLRDVADCVARANAGVHANRQPQTQDALAIVQSGAWASQAAVTFKAKFPTFALYSKQTFDDIKELVQEGLRLTLESDPEQRVLSETPESPRPSAAGPHGRRASIAIRNRKASK